MPPSQPVPAHYDLDRSYASHAINSQKCSEIRKARQPPAPPMWREARRRAAHPHPGRPTRTPLQIPQPKPHHQHPRPPTTTHRAKMRAQLKTPGIRTTTPRKRSTTPAVSHKMALVQSITAQTPKLRRLAIVEGSNHCRKQKTITRRNLQRRRSRYARRHPSQTLGPLPRNQIHGHSDAEAATSPNVSRTPLSNRRRRSPWPPSARRSCVHRHRRRVIAPEPTANRRLNPAL